MMNKWKKSTKFTNHKYGKTCCETNDVLLQDPFDSLCGKPQSGPLTSGANMLDLRSEALP
jgi:hypothetical protein